MASHRTAAPHVPRAARTHRCRHRSQVLIGEGPGYELWMCTRCERRTSRTAPQLALFSNAQAQAGGRGAA